MNKKRNEPARDRLGRFCNAGAYRASPAGRPTVFTPATDARQQLWSALEQADRMKGSPVSSSERALGRAKARFNAKSWWPEKQTALAPGSHSMSRHSPSRKMLRARLSVWGWLPKLSGGGQRPSRMGAVRCVQKRHW